MCKAIWQYLLHMNTRGILYFFLFSSCFAFHSFGQKASWQRNRENVSFGLGAANFLGDLGGGDEIGRDGLADYDFLANRPTLQLNYTFRFSGRISSSVNLSYGRLKGNDEFTNEDYRNGRNLHFRSAFFESSLLLKLDFFGPSLKKNKQGFVSKGFRPINFYGIAGLGIMFFNPQARYNGNWVDLQELGTEGQGLPGMPEPYDKHTLVIPYGFGIGKDIGQFWSVNAEFMFRLTFTDYIDDVSTDYYGKNDLIQNKLNSGFSLEEATMVAELSDPNIYATNYSELGIRADTDLKGEQRGDPSDNDAYLTMMITISRKINFLTNRRRAF